MISKNPIKFSIVIHPNASCFGEQSEQDDLDDEDEEEDDDESSDNVQTSSPYVKLEFEFPPKYPDEKPSITITESKNLDEDLLTELTDMLSKKAEESLGTVMTFMIVSDLVEWLSALSERDLVERELELEKRKQELEAEQAKKFDGTPVTEETFLEWKKRFDAEMSCHKLDPSKNKDLVGATSVKRLTGRAMFESDKTLAESDLNFVEDLDQNQMDAFLQEVDDLDLDESELESREESDDDYSDQTDTDTEN